MAIYINGIGSISPQETRNNSKFLTEVLEYTAAYLPIAEPPYKEYIHPKELRRMSKVIRNSIIAARISLEDSKLEMPDAILTGTGLGCAVDTEKFLTKMTENKETLLTPTSFIQSTHNTIGGSIAIGLGCHNYNMTYVHRGFSFETALHDAVMMLNANEIENALVGGFDEMTDNHIVLLKSTGIYQDDGFSNFQLKKPEHNGTLSGQGASFFVLEKEKSPSSYAQILDLKFFYKPDSVEKTINNFLEANSLKAKNIDLLLMGYNGISSESKVYDAISEQIFTDTPRAWFKHLCGEYYTASAFGTWVAAQILQKQHIPESIVYKGKAPKEIKNILFYNQFQGNEHSLILFSQC
jgi:3-oxoacyl-(acyl-carrier-protein) synthase